MSGDVTVTVTQADASVAVAGGPTVAVPSSTPSVISLFPDPLTLPALRVPFGAASGSGAAATDATFTFDPATGKLSAPQLNLSGLTASTLVATDANKNLTSSVSGLSPTFTGLTLSGLTAGRVPFSSTGGLLTDSESLGYSETSGPRLAVGSGSTTSVGGALGYYGSTGYGALWLGSASPTVNNHVLTSNNTALYVNSGHNASGSISFQHGNGAARLYLDATAGFGARIAAGVATTDVQALSLTQTMSAPAVNFTGVKGTFTEGASGTGSGTKLLDLLYGTSGAEASRFSVSKPDASNRVSIATGAGDLIIAPYTGILYFGSTGAAGMRSSIQLALAGNASLSWTDSINNFFSATQDLVLLRDAAGTLAQRNGTNAQASRIYNTYTDASNYERGGLKWSSNLLQLFSESAGTGTGRSIWVNPGTGQGVYIGNGSYYWQVNGSGHLITSSGDNALDIGASGATRPRNIYVGTDVVAGGAYKRGSDQVVGARVTGWAAPTGTLDRTTFDESTVTLPELAQRVAALVTDLRTHGLINN